MKRTYEKPEIMFESFALNTSISAGCEATVPLAAQGITGCGIAMGPEDVVFVDTVSGCSDEWTTDDGEFNGYCYHVFDGRANWFNS